MDVWIIPVIVALFASQGLWTFLIEIYKNHGKRCKSPSEKMLLALGRDKLLTMNKTYRALGYIPTEEYETYTALGNAYIMMQGNSTVRKGFEDNLKLPIKDDEE